MSPSLANAFCVLCWTPAKQCEVPLFLDFACANIFYVWAKYVAVGSLVKEVWPWPKVRLYNPVRVLSALVRKHNLALPIIV